MRQLGNVSMRTRLRRSNETFVFSDTTFSWVLKVARVESSAIVLSSVI